MSQVPDGSISDYPTAKGRRWRYVIDAPGADGRRRQVKRSGFTSKAKARAALDDLRRQLYAGLVPVPDASSVAGFARDFVDALGAEGLEPRTVDSYRQSLDRLLPTIGHIRLQDLTELDLDRAYTELRERPLSARSVVASHVAVKKMLGEAKRLRRVATNVANDARPPKASAARAKRFPTWTVEQLRRFLGALEGDRDFALWHVAGYTGLRRGELVALCWDEVDLDAGVLRVVRAIGEGGGRRYEKRPKSEAGRRSVELAPETVRVLTSHRREQKERRLLVGPGWRDHNLVFPDVDGSPVRPGVVTEHWQLVMRHHAESLGLAAIRFHDLRHSHATQLLASGARADVVSKRLGHSSVAFTLSTYAHVLDGDQRASVSRLFA